MNDSLTKTKNEYEGWVKVLEKEIFQDQKSKEKVQYKKHTYGKLAGPQSTHEK